MVDAQTVDIQISLGLDFDTRARLNHPHDVHVRDHFFVGADQLSAILPHGLAGDVVERWVGNLEPKVAV